MGDQQADWRSISSNAYFVAVCCAEKGAESEAESGILPMVMTFG